jgi:HD superfamily phosphohydrolase YqeK
MEVSKCSPESGFMELVQRGGREHILDLEGEEKWHSTLSACLQRKNKIKS